MVHWFPVKEVQTRFDNVKPVVTEPYELFDEDGGEIIPESLKEEV